ncbi:hypothetical protein [Nocardia yamanashiensis]|uniref:hypothetical protein n=1 Tax=Nocardia yamanashiensis TaxID=209247 RepID=UPI00082A79B0|nr:hypothetical protein [Nocardia yamanashiensis]
MTTLSGNREFRIATTESHVPAMFSRINARLARLTALFAAAGRAVPFHRESSWDLAGSTNFQDRDRERAAHDIRAIAGMREHG